MYFVHVAFVCHMGEVPLLGPGHHQPYKSAYGMATGGLLLWVSFQPMLFFSCCMFPKSSPVVLSVGVCRCAYMSMHATPLHLSCTI